MNREILESKELNDAINNLNINILKNITYSQEIELNDKFTLYHYIEEDKIVINETENWEEILEVFYDEDTSDIMYEILI
jgi:hypothetical protein